MAETESFPRRQARTQRFTLGEPRNIRVSDDGARVAFLRSSGPVDPVNALWVLDVATGTERLAADPRRLGSAAGEADQSAPANGGVPGPADGGGGVSGSADGGGGVSGSADGGGGVSGSADGGGGVSGSADGGGGVSGSADGGGGVSGSADGGGGVSGPADDSGGAGIDDELPPAERARRERVRESGSGIVSYNADSGLTAAVFALGGRLWRVGLGDGDGPPEMLRAQPGAFDPRLSPDGRRVAYVAGSAMRVTGDDGDRTVVDEPGDTVSWGSAEFVAAEEMGRTRGHWWSPDGRRLLAARVDTAPVPRWWIADPAAPDAAPTEIRYPAAGTANAAVGLAVFDVASGSESAAGRSSAARRDGIGGAAGGAADGRESRRVDVAWDEGGWEYLAAVDWSEGGLLLTAQSRDQRTLGVLEADPASGACRLLHRVRDDAWVELVPGAPRLAAGRLVTVEDRGPARRLCADGEALTPDHVQVRAVSHADDAGVVVTASVDPADVHALRVDWNGTLEWLTTGPGVSGVVVGGDTTVVVRRSLTSPGRRCTVRSPQYRVSRRGDGGAGHGGVRSDQDIATHAERAGLDLNVEIVELGPRRLTSAIVIPSGPAGADRGPLPVLLDPYGGPHAQRVQRAEALFHTSQWFADQGFAVLVIDGRGTPGRGPRFERAVHGDLAGPVLEDQIDALHAAARRDPRLDLSRVAIRGWSFGGYLAALAVLRRPDVFAAAVAGAPVTDWRLYDTHYTERYLGHPAAEPANYERTDLSPLAPGLQRPLLLIHGLADDNVVAAHTLRLSRALLEAGRPHTVLPLCGVTHMTPQEEVAENLLLIQLRFLRAALGMPPLPPEGRGPGNYGGAGDE